jgi:hypothetical protein
MHFMVPVSRMGLSVVVAQYVYVLYLMGSARQMQLFTTFAQVKEGIAGFAIMSVIGLVIYLLFEAPVVNLLFELVGTKRPHKGVTRPSKLRVDLSQFCDQNGNLLTKCVQDTLTPCSPDIEQKQL